MFKRMVVYLYYYENGEKKKNCGYAKLTMHHEECRVEVNMIDAPELEGDIRLCFCRKQQEQIVVEEAMRGIVEQGDMCLRYESKCNELAGGILLEELAWILVISGDNFAKVVCGAVKQEEPDFKGFLRMQGSDVQPEEKEQEEKTDSYESPDVSRESEAESTQFAVQQVEDETTIYEYDRECLEQKGQCKESPQTSTGWQEKLFHTFPKVIVHINGVETTGIRLRPQDMVWFPSEYWRVATNKFLLNSYYNYRHILFFKGTGKQEGKYYLGLPGMLQENHAVTASKFGFPEFFRAGQDAEHQLTCQVRREKFGFWCRET